MEKNNRTEFVRLLGCTRLIVDGRTQIDFTEDEFKALMLGVLNDIWNLKGQTTDSEKLSWLADVQQHLAPAQYCSKCEGKTNAPSDEGLCAWCFDDAEKAVRA